jgi:hypothetical protein
MNRGIDRLVIRWILVLLPLASPALRACEDNNWDNEDPIEDSPPDPGDGGAWGDNGDGTFTWLPESPGGNSSTPDPSPPPTPPGPPAITWSSLPGGSLDPGAGFTVEALGSDAAGLLATVSVDESRDGGESWAGYAYGGGGDGWSAQSGNPAAAEAGDSYQFRAWATDSLGQSSGAIYSPVYAVNSPPPTYPVSIQASGPGSVSTTGGWYQAGSVLSVAATPNSGSQFVGWSGDLSGSATPASLSVAGPTSVTASFAANQAKLTLATIGNGSVSGGGTFPTGSRVDVRADPATDAIFTGWSPGGSLDDPTAPATTVTLNQDLTITASFSPATALLTTLATGSGQVTGAGTYPLHALATVAAVPAAGERFTGWQGDLAGTANPASLVMDGPRTVTGVFAGLLGQTITVTPVPAQSVASPPVLLKATATSGLPVSFQFVSGPGQLSGSTVTLTGVVGTISLIASQPGDGTFSAAAPVSFSFPVGSSTRRTILTATSAATKKNDPVTPATGYQMAPSHP